MNFVRIPPPLDWPVFERNMRVLFECHLKNKGVLLHGRQGQSQDGSDIFGESDDEQGNRILFAVQCKVKNASEEITKKELYKEVERVGNFKPPISHFYFVTTAPRDVKIQRIAREINDEKSQSENEFTVEVWGWEDIQERLQEDGNQKARKMFDTRYKGVESEDAVNEIKNFVEKGNNEILDNLKNPSPEKIIIEECRKLIKKNKLSTAYESLEELENKLDSNASLADKAEILTLKGNCKHGFGDFEGAAELFLKAYEICPDMEGADARKILALAFQEKGEEAVQFGLDSMASTKNKKLLCTHIIHAKISCKEKEESPFDFIPEDVEEDENIAIAKINYLRNKGDIKWQKLACDVASKYPNDKAAMLLCAEAIFDKINLKFRKSGGGINLKDSAKLEKAIGILNDIHEDLKISEVAWNTDHIHIIYNLSNAYYLIGNDKAAEKTLNEAKFHDPNNKLLAIGRFMVASKNNDLDAMEELIPNLPPKEENTIIGKMQFFINSENWNEIKSLPKINKIKNISKPNKAFYEIGKAFAEWQLDNNIDIKKMVEKLEVKYPKEIIIPIISHHIAFLNNNESWRKKYYTNALDRMEQMPDIYRPMLIDMALIEKDFKTIISILDGNVDYNNDSNDLRLLIFSYANMPPQKSSRDFINKLSSELKSDPYYTGAIGIIESNRGNLADAESYLRKSLHQNPNDLQFQLGLINVLYRGNREHDIKTHLRTINLPTLFGNPIEKIQMSSLLIKYSEVKRGLEYAYKVAVDNYDNAEIISAYTSILLLCPDKEKVEIETVEMNTCVEFLYNGKTQQRVFIEEKNNSSLNYDMHSDKAAKLFIGEKKGKTITIEPDIGTPKKYKIIDIFDTPTGLFRDIIRRSQSFSSDESNFHKYELEENDGVPDFQPLLEDVKTLSKDKEKFKNAIIDLYLNNPYPLSILAKLAKNQDLDILLVAGLITNEGHFIKSCIGFSKEIKKAIELCESALETGIVLDTYTAIVAQQCGILPILKLIFSKIIIPQSTIDEVNTLREKVNFMGDGFMTYQNGQHFFSKITPDDKSKEISLYTNMINDFKNTFEICPSDFPNSPSDLELEICRDSGHILDSGHLCVANKIPILSDDMHYRELISHLYQVAGFWLQIPLIIALQKNMIDEVSYVKTLAKLAACKHSYIFINAYALIVACTLDEENLESLVNLIGLIYCPNSDFDSHTDELLIFVISLWGYKPISEVRKKKVMGLILERIHSAIKDKRQIKKTIDIFLKQSWYSGNYKLYDYIFNWMKGHFINI